MKECKKSVCMRERCKWELLGSYVLLCTCMYERQTENETELDFNTGMRVMNKLFDYTQKWNRSSSQSHRWLELYVSVHSLIARRRRFNFL